MLFRKMYRDICANKAQFIAIFLMIFLGVFIFAGVNSDWNGMKVSSGTFYDESKLADVWVYSNGFSKDDVEVLKKEKGIDEVERRASFDTYVKDNKKKKITLFIVEDYKLSQMKVVKGEAYQKDVDGIWIDQSYATENNLKIGQKYAVEMNGISIEKEIKGFVYHPEMVYQKGNDTILPDHKHQGYALVSSDNLPFDDHIPYTQLLIKTKNPTTMDSIVRDALGKSNLTFIEREDMLSYATLQAEIEQHQAFSKVFPAVFLLIAVLTTMTTLSKMIMNQRLQIGILKALGFKNRKVTFHYLSHVVVIATVGAILGFVIGPLIIPELIFPMMRSVYVLPELKPYPVDSSVYMVFASIIVCFGVAFIITRKQLKEKPASALRPKVVIYQKKREHSSSIWNKLNFYAQWNVRDIFRNKIRSLIAIIGVAGCMGLMICAFGMQNSMDHMMNMMFHELSTYEMRVQVGEDGDHEKVKERMNGSFIQEGAMEYKYKNEKKTGNLLIQEDTQYMKMQDEDLKEVELPKDGIALSYNIAKEYDIKRGDFVSWRIMGNKTWVKSKVKEIIHTPSTQGITMSKEVFNEAGMKFIPSAVVGKSANVKSIKGVLNIQYLKGDIENSMETMMQGMNLLIGILIFGAVVLGLVVLYNIGTFSYYEKIREMATLKVLGFRNQKVKKLLSQQNLWLTIVGILLGLPFGYTLIYSVVSTVGSSMDMQIMIAPSTILGCSLATLIVSYLVVKIVSLKTRKIDMVSALKAME